MIFLMVVGAGMLLSGGWMLWSVLQFYAGTRRELYFHPNRAWVGTARLGGLLFINGGGLVSLGILGQQGQAPFILGGCFFLVIVWWIGLPLALELLPPRWLHDLEQGRSPEDLEAIRLNGAAMLTRQPDRFRSMIRDAAGWENWLMTVTEPIPLAMLEMLVRRAQFAMQHNLHPIAISAAEEIIRYRPNQALGYYLRALAHLRNHQHADALDDLNACLRFQPHDAELYIQRGRIYLMLGQVRAGLADLDHAQTLRPDDPQIRMLQEAARQRLKLMVP